MAELDIEDESPEREHQEGDPYNAASRKEVTERAKTKKQLEKTRSAVMAALMENKEGREFLAWLLFQVCGMRGPTENAAFDTNALHFREGQRAVGLVLESEALRSAKQLYIVMLGEHLH